MRRLMINADDFAITHKNTSYFYNKQQFQTALADVPGASCAAS